MVRVLGKKGGGKVQEGAQSFDDIEGLVINLGIVAALVLSFVVGLVATIPTEEYDKADLTTLVFYWQDFRNYIDPDGLLRVSYGISDLEMITGEKAGDGGYDCTEDAEQKDKYLPGLRMLASTVDLTDMRGWVDTHYKKVHEHAGCIGRRLPSEFVTRYGVVTVIILTIILIHSTSMYVSIMWLDARESPEVAAYWYKSGKWMLLFGYALLIAACIMFFYTFISIIAVRVPHAMQVNEVKVITGAGLGIGFALTIIPVLVLHVLTHRNQAAIRATGASEESKNESL